VWLCLGGNCPDGDNILVKVNLSRNALSRLNITAGGLISGRPRQGWRVFCQSRQMDAKPRVRVKADYV